MSTSYRISRNIEASLIDYLRTQLATAWSNISVQKGFIQEATTLPAVFIRVSDTDHNWAEVGSSSTIRNVLVLIDLFCTSDGQRLDLKDYLISKLKEGLVYYEYVIDSGTVFSKTANGRLRVMEISDTPVDFDIDKSSLDVKDRFRHLLTLNVQLGRVET